MNKLIAIVSFALSLYGCDVGGSTYVHRSSADGNDVLYSKVVAKPGFTRFECLASASGQCHYTLYAGDCPPPSTQGSSNTPPPAHGCQPKRAKHFALASGDSRRMPTLSRFRMCVSTDSKAAIPGCDPASPMASL